MKAVERIIVETLDTALSHVDPDKKKAFYRLLEENQGIKPVDIPRNYAAVYKIIKTIYGDKRFAIQRAIIKTLQENTKKGLYEPYDEATAYCMIIDVFSKETAEHIEEVKKLTTLKKYAENLEEKVKSYDEKMKSSERMVAIGETAAMVGHDIRNPLQAMISDIYLLKLEIASMPLGENKKEVTESLESLEKNIAYINKIVADLQDYANPLKPEYSKVNLQCLISDLLKTLDVPGNIRVESQIDVHSEVMTEPTFVRRMLTNLVNNAIQAMPDGGILGVRASENKSALNISISDTGNGVPEVVKENLFKPMITTKSKGQGFGLAVVKRLVDALNGEITLETTNRKGTTFKITLPLKISDFLAT